MSAPASISVLSSFCDFGRGLHQHDNHCIATLERHCATEQHTLIVVERRETMGADWIGGYRSSGAGETVAG